jgi:hypothetical protein
MEGKYRKVSVWNRFLFSLCMSSYIPIDENHPHICAIDRAKFLESQFATNLFEDIKALWGVTIFLMEDICPHIKNACSSDSTDKCTFFLYFHY